MKKILFIIAGIVLVAVLAIVLFNSLSAKKAELAFMTQVEKGDLRITVKATGELEAETSVEILAPNIEELNQQQYNPGDRQIMRSASGSQGGSRGGGGGFSGGGFSGGRGGGGDIRATPIKITDMIPEGTIVKKGDYIAQLDRTEYDNTLKDDYSSLTSYETNLNLKVIDSAVTLNQIRDDITNQKYAVSEAQEKLRNSQYESPDIKRQAEINYERAQRLLEQKTRHLKLMQNQVLTDIINYQWLLSRVQNRIHNLETLLGMFTIRAPSDGMVIYMKDRRGQKREVGSMITSYDRVVATIPDLTTLTSKIYVNEIEVSKVVPGLKVDITVDAFPLRSYTGTVQKVANIGEVLPNSDSKVFETYVTLDHTDQDLRPSMTTGNEIIIKEINDVIYVPTECIRTDSENITYVYTRNRLKQVVVAGEANDKFTVIEQGLKPGTNVYFIMPDDYEKFTLAGEDLIPIIKERNKARSQFAVIN